MFYAPRASGCGSARAPAARRGRRGRRLAGDGRLITQLLNLLDERQRLHDRRIEINLGGLAVESHFRLVNPGDQLQLLSDLQGARLAVHSLDVKLSLHQLAP